MIRFDFELAAIIFSLLRNGTGGNPGWGEYIIKSITLRCAQIRLTNVPLTLELSTRTASHLQEHISERQSNH
jgi:hypothetical protein